MDTNTIISDLLKAVLTVGIPILGTYLVAFIQSKSKALSASTNSVMIKDLVAGAEKVVTDVVTCTNQTFVDGLKGSGTFDAAAAKQAFEKTKDAVLKILPQTTKDALATLYGDLDTWLESKIEAAVYAKKGSDQISRPTSD